MRNRTLLTIGMAAGITIAAAGTHAVVRDSKTTLEERERMRTEKRIIRVRVYHDANGKIHSAMASPEQVVLMRQLDAEGSERLLQLQTQAIKNSFRPDAWIAAGQRLLLPGAVDEMEPH